VANGELHIESYDIITLLEARFPDPCLIQKHRADEIANQLQQEDHLHHALRILT